MDWGDWIRTVTGLGALLADVAKLVTVAALNVGRVLGLSALLGDMTLLAAVAAAARACLRAVLGEMANCVMSAT